MTGGGDVVARREIAGGLALLGLAAVPSLRSHPPAWEMGWFRAVNDRSDSWHVPVWPVMQLGALAAAPATAIAALAAGEPRLARRLVLGGTAVWATAKVVKRLVVRARPAAYADRACPGPGGDRPRVPVGACGGGDRPGGSGGDVGATPNASRGRCGCGDGGRLPGLRGAHLPLDVLGGAALGLVVDGVMRLADRGARLTAVAAE